MQVLTIVKLIWRAQELTVNFIKIIAGQKGKGFECKNNLIKKTL